MTDATIHPQSRAPKQAPRPAPLAKPKRISPAKQRKLVETAIERLIDLLDAIDPDPDLEYQCEDEGAQCDDEGVPNDEREPDYRNYGVPPEGYVGFTSLDNPRPIVEEQS